MQLRDHQGKLDESILQKQEKYFVEIWKILINESKRNINEALEKQLVKIL